MGKSETASASIGIKILLSDLILQINETNLNLIKKMLYDGCIEDSNGYYNESYINILGYPYGEDKLTGDYLECKEYLINEFKTNGSYYKSKFSSKVESDLHNGSLFERYLLVPVKDILNWNTESDKHKNTGYPKPICVYEEQKEKAIAMFRDIYKG